MTALTLIRISFLVFTLYAITINAPAMGEVKKSEIETSAPVSGTTNHLPSSEKCSAQERIVEIGNVKLSVHRNAHIRLEDGEQKLMLERMCGIKVIKKVKSAAWATPEYFNFIKSGTGMTSYQMSKEAIAEARASNHIRRINESLEELINVGEDIYILSIEGSTSNAEPIVFKCNKMKMKIEHLSYCMTSYEHPLGFKFSYRFSRKDIQPENFVKYDQEKRLKIESMLR